MSKSKVLVDTSIQIGRFKYEEIDDHLQSLQQTDQLKASFFTLFEFKVGLILSLINYWDYVNAHNDVSRAMIKWSELQSRRDPKNLIIVQAIIIKRFGQITANKKKHLRSIEWAIFSMLKNFFTYIDKYPIGDFRYEEIIKYKVNSSEDFPNFVKLCSEKKEMINQEDFWTKHNKELLALVNDVDFAKSYKDLHGALSRVHADLRYANMVRTNKVVGDAVIAVEVREGMRVLTTDGSFEFLCPILNKGLEKIPNQY